MIILAIETSCDDTCVAVIKASSKKKPRFEILSNIVSSQVEVHKKWGGIYPALAKREHQKNLPIILKKVLKKTKVDLIAVTIGPGLEPCLWVGINFAKALSHSLGVPIVPINHIEGHILANFVGENSKFEIRNSKFFLPAVCLVVSGGHTQLILMKDFGNYQILGETRDDAAGECFDKVAKILGLGYPGGPAIAKQASQWKSEIRKQPSGESASRPAKFEIKLPRPMINQKNYDFSFSGLKTAVLYNYKSQPEKIRKSKKYIREMCYETQQAIIDVLLKKTIRAVKNYRAKIPTTKSSRIHDRIGTIILGGGVTANDELRKQFNYKLQTTSYPDFPAKENRGSSISLQRNRDKLKLLVPPKNLCTDNAVMTAIAGYYNLNKKTKNWKKIKADANIRL